MSSFDYVAVGHVTCDAIEHPKEGTIRQPGGSAFYSALQAARLGLRTLILTQGIPEEIEALLAPYSDELELHVMAARHTTTLATRGSGAGRTQRMLAWAEPIVVPFELNTDILHLAPIARETPTAWRGRASFVGVTPQGLVRDWHGGEMSQIELDPTLLPGNFNAAAISEHERASCRPLFATARGCGAPVAVTAGARPTTIYLSDGTDAGEVVQTCSPPTVVMIDDLGAGDVFAAAFFVALAEGRAVRQAVAYGNAAAAYRVARLGPSAIASRAAIIP